MRIALVCSHGGHLTEILRMKEAFEGHATFIVTYSSKRTQEMKLEKYLLKNIGINPIFMANAYINFFKILRKERPNVIISTGSEIAIPAFILGKIFGIKTIYIETWCRITSSSGTGKILYPFSDLFLVQRSTSLSLFGSKAQYCGAII